MKNLLLRGRPDPGFRENTLPVDKRLSAHSLNERWDGTDTFLNFERNFFCS